MLALPLVFVEDGGGAARGTVDEMEANMLGVHWRVARARAARTPKPAGKRPVAAGAVAPAPPAAPRRLRIVCKQAIRPDAGAVEPVDMSDVWYFLRAAFGVGISRSACTSREYDTALCCSLRAGLARADFKVHAKITYGEACKLWGELSVDGVSCCGVYS